MTYIESKLKGMSDIKVQQELGNQLVKLPRGRNLSNDEYAKNVIKSVSDLTAEFYELSETLCGPLVEHFNYETKTKAKKKLSDSFFLNDTTGGVV